MKNKKKPREFHIAESYTLERLRERNYNPAMRDWIPEHDWEDCVHILQVISDNGVPCCAKCGEDPLFLTFSSFLDYDVREFYGVEEIGSGFSCSFQGETDWEACECEELVWTNQQAVKAALADDLEEAKRQLALERADLSSS